MNSIDRMSAQKLDVFASFFEISARLKMLIIVAKNS